MLTALPRACRPVVPYTGIGLGRVQYGDGEFMLLAAFGAPRRLWLGGGGGVFHFFDPAPTGQSADVNQKPVGRSGRGQPGGGPRNLRPRLNSIQATGDGNRPIPGGLTTLWFHRVVARGAVKVADIPGPNNLKSFRDAIHLYFPRIFISCRKLGYAGLSATRASKLLNPTIAGHS